MQTVQSYPVSSHADDGTDAPFLRLDSIHKRFGGVHALRGMTLSIVTGRAYHLLGENGCGKSTLIKIISGAQAPSEGAIVLDGRETSRLSPIEALAAGIETVYQDLSLLPNLSVAENVALNDQLVAKSGRLASLVSVARLRDVARAALERVGLPSTPTFLATPVGELPLATRQLVAIARAIATRARLVIMDEPTTSLTRREVDNLVQVVQRLLTGGVAVLFVTHKLDECYRIGGRVIVLRDGECVAEGPLENYSRRDLSALMTGKSLDGERYRTGVPGAPGLFRAEGLSAGVAFQDVSLTVAEGEILGITGLADSGRNELIKTIAGIRPVTAGAMWLGGARLEVRRPRDAIHAGVAYVPEDRLVEGLFLEKSILENKVALVLRRLASALGIVRSAYARALADQLKDEMRINAPDIDRAVSSLSGGNQQRVLIGRSLAIKPRLLLLHGPTVGVDVGSKDTIFRAVQGFAEAGMGIVIVSDDLPELLQNCDRILIMRDGHIVEEMQAAEGSEEHIYQSMLTTAVAP